MKFALTASLMLCLLWGHPTASLADPLPEYIACADAGGTWDECGSGGGPFTCDNLPNPDEICTTGCVPQCICPGEAVWDNGACTPISECGNNGGGEPPPPQGEDADGDGWTKEAGDCDDQAASVYPGAPEACDGLDNDCNGLVDDAPCPGPGEDDQGLCAATGGNWNACGSGCGPFTCEEPAPDPGGCPELCVAQCDCLDGSVWKEGVGCIPMEDCGDANPEEDKDNDGWSTEQGDCDDTDPNTNTSSANDL